MGRDENRTPKIFETHKDAVYGFALRMTGSADAAEDIAQECPSSLEDAQAVRRHARTDTAMATGDRAHHIIALESRRTLDFAR